MANLDLDKLILHFAHYDETEGKSPSTVLWYTEMLSAFAKFHRSVGATAILSEFNLLSERDFTLHEPNKPASPYTV